MIVGRKKHVLNGDDIISRLPTHVLSKIFEYLPVKDAARTSILSTKWRYLWSAYPYLVFDKRFYETITVNKLNSDNKYVNMIYKALLVLDVPDSFTNLVERITANKRNSPAKYIDVINKVLFNHEGSVLDFDLYIPNLDYEWDEHIDGWLSFLSRNGIQNLCIDCQQPTSYKLSSCIFSSRNLTYLKLVNIMFKPPVGFSSFASLVELECHKITFGACSIDDVSPVAPLLKKLIFQNCTDIEYFNIYAPQAKTLLVYPTNDVPLVFFDKFPNLSVICILVGELHRVASRRSFIGLCQLHEKFPTLSKLAVDGGYLKLSASATIKRRLDFVYHDLTYLCVNDLSFNDFDQVSCVLWLLNSSSNLTRFEAVVSPFKRIVEESVLNHLESRGCMGKLLKLQTVKLEILAEGSKSELVFIKSILAHSPNLKSMYVYFRMANMDKRIQFVSELMRFPRESKVAEVIYGCWFV